MFKSPEKIDVLLTGNSFERVSGLVLDLESAGFQVSFALGFDAARRAMRYGSPDILVCDSGFSFISALELFREIRSYEANDDTCVVMLSENTLDGQSISDAFAAGADDCIPAGTAAEYLAAKLDWLVRQKRKTEQKKADYRLLRSRQLQIMNIARHASRLAGMPEEALPFHSGNEDIIGSVYNSSGSQKMETHRNLSPGLLSSLANLLDEQVRALDTLEYGRNESPCIPPPASNGDILSIDAML